MKRPIGIFDSGFGGLTVMKEIINKLPEYDYVYLGDNARAPYGTRSFQTVYEYTLQCVEQLFAMHCELVILACNTASAKALRTIQQKNLTQFFPGKRVLGVIRPTAEIVGNYSKSKHIGVLGTNGTTVSNSYPIEIGKIFPDIIVYQEACPMWVPLIENNEFNTTGADYFIKKNLDNLFSKSSKIDTIILGCTHYPLLIDKIKKHIPNRTTILSQGEIVANSLVDYLYRHPEIEEMCSKGEGRNFFTTDSNEKFDTSATLFFGKEIISETIHLH